MGDRGMSHLKEVQCQWSYTSVLPLCHPGVDRDSFTFFTVKATSSQIFTGYST